MKIFTPVGFFKEVTCALRCDGRSKVENSSDLTVSTK